MLRNYIIFITFVNVLLVNFPLVVHCNEKQETSIKNMTDIDKAKPKSKHDDPFKKDIRKYLRECGVAISGEDDDDDDDDDDENRNRGERGDSDESAEEIFPKGHQPNPRQPNANWAYENKKKGNNKGTYPSHYGKKKGGNRSDEESDEEDDDDDDDYRGSSSSNRRKGGSNRRNNRKGNKNRPSHDYDDSRDRDNCEDDRDRRGGSGGRKDYSSSQGNRNPWGNSGSGWSSNRGGSMGGNHGGSRYNNNGYFSSSDPYALRPDYGMYSGDTDMWGGSRGGSGFSVYGGRIMAMNERLRRNKRQQHNEEQQCISQCVFGYLEMLDDNRVPAETEVIKYFLNKIPNNSERVRLIKLARRCFAKLSTAELTENEDGCQFSKDLAKCLHIEIKTENI